MIDTKKKFGFALRLATVMNERFVSAKQLAGRSGLNQQYVYRVLRGDALPGWNTVCSIADALFIRVGELRDPPERPYCDACLLNPLARVCDHQRADDFKMPIR